MSNLPWIGRLACVALATLSCGAAAWAQSPPLSAAESDPVKMGWMVGAPPPPDKLILFADGSHLRFPQLRWSVANFRRFMPSANVWRGDGPVSPLPRALRTDIDAVKFQPLGGGEALTWAQSLDANYTDAIIVLHQGRVVYERYLGVMTPHSPHMAMSVTKSMFGTLGAMLVAEGKLDANALVTKYIPELAGSGWADATVRQVLDMTTGLEVLGELRRSAGRGLAACPRRRHPAAPAGLRGSQRASTNSCARCARTASTARPSPTRR